MKNIGLVFLLFIMVSCKNQNEVSKTESTTQTSNPAEENAATPTSIAEAKNFVSKKATDVKLFEQFNLNQRIEKLLGTDFTEFKADWNEENLISQDGEILYFSGCRKGACADNKYFVLLDMMENNINIINIRNGRPKSFEEGAVIGMTDKVAEEFERIRNATGL
jgi:hypothetical protein